MWFWGSGEVSIFIALGPIPTQGTIPQVRCSITGACDGGTNFLFADGSVHFLAYSAASVVPALATRAGGEVIGDY